MACKLTWYNLPNQIKQIGEELKESVSQEIYQEFKTLTWYNLPNKLNSIIRKLTSEFSICTDVVYNKTIWYTLNKKAEILCQIKDDILACDSFNFDITADWSLTLDENGESRPVTDKESFIQFLTNGTNIEEGNTLQNIEVSNFSLVDGRLQCKLKATGDNLNIGYIELTEFNSIGNINPLNSFSIYQGNLTEFNPLTALPSSLKNFSIVDNPLSNFDPEIPLPSGLETLGIGCPITEFDPSLPLPANLRNLGLNNINFQHFDPSLQLPANLNTLAVRGGALIDFNPSVSLPTSLIQILVDQNEITDAGYTASEAWANAQPPFIQQCTFNTNGNPDSAVGTNLATILLTKNVTTV